MRTSGVTSGWTVEVVGGEAPPSVLGPHPATVPGCVHTDLMAAGLLEDPYRDDVEHEIRWMHDLDWRYRTVLAPAELDLSRPGPGERVDLVLEGVDTVATVRWGEVVLGRSENMHRSQRYDVTPHLTGDAVVLSVDIESATRHAEAERERLGDRPSPYPTPFNVIRKMASSMGWDWGPDLRTAGLWRPVRLDRWAVARLDEVRPLVSVADGVGRVEVHVVLARAAPEEVVVAAEVLGRRAEARVAVGDERVVLAVDVEDPPLWWPVGHGGQPLCDLVVTVSSGTAELDRWSRRIGFRTVRLDTSPDAFGTRFTLAVNGKELFVKGANWIPDDHFVSRVTPERLARRLDQAVGANLDLVRVWGGGIFESEDFYTACDERGLMVWQDFLLACAAYPEEAPLMEEIEAEARENVVRLMPHPSVVLYNGGNENLWGHEDWGWSEALDGRTWGARYAHEVLPRVVASLDPTRPYCANSPYSPGPGPGTGADGIHPNDPDHGTHHQWDVWNRLDYTAYRSEVPRFCSEFGFQAPPTWRTLTDWVHAADGGPLADAADFRSEPHFLAHQKAEDGDAKLDRGLGPHLGVPDRFDDWLWATQLNQAHAVTYAIDHYRRWWPRTAGAVVWQLNDCWPAVSWAAVDYGERPKPLWYALRAAFAPRRLVVSDEDGRLAVTAVNDTDDPWTGRLHVRREQLDGRRLATAEVDLDVAARSVSSTVVEGPVAAPDDPTREVVVARLEEVTAVHTFVPDLELELEPDPATVEATAVPGGYRVAVSARSFTKDLTLLVDRVAADASVDDGVVSLPAGDRAVLHVTTGAAGLEQRLTAPPVLRTSNDLPRGTGARA